MRKHYLFDEMVREDALALGRYEFLEKYDKDSEEFFDQVKAEKIRAIVKQTKKEIKKDRTKKEYYMSRVSDWLLEMEEDAAHLTLNEWIAKHGSVRKEIWDRVQTEREEDQHTMELLSE